MSKFKEGDKVLFYRDVSNASKNDPRSKLVGSIITLGPESDDGRHMFGSTMKWTIVEDSMWIVRDNEIQGLTKLHKALL